jgi:dTDP-4-dehydrorhamnose reductase
MKPVLLVTGASGLVGSHVVARARVGWQVHGIYLRHPVSLEGVHWHRLDLTDAEEVAALVRSLAPRAIVHAAAMTNVDQAEIERPAAEAANVLATRYLAQVAEAVNARMVYVSSDMVLDGERSWYKESDPARPINFYGETKLAGEQEVKEVCSHWVVARTALIYGRPIFGTNSASEWLLEALRAGQTVKLFHDQYRTPIWVDTLAEALLELCELDWTGLVHLGGPERLSRLEFGQKVCRAFAFPETLLQPVSMDSVGAIAARPRDASLDTTLARTLLSTPLLDCDTALRRMADPSPE